MVPNPHCKSLHKKSPKQAQAETTFFPEDYLGNQLPSFPPSHFAHGIQTV
jgi:hypothetical protein